MYAIIEESGSQRKVMKDEQFLVDLLEQGQVQKGAKVTFDRVLLVGEVGGGAKVGQPYVKGASVTAEVLEPVVLGDKIHIQKFAAKKTWRKKTGHRQRFTLVRVASING